MDFEVGSVPELAAVAQEILKEIRYPVVVFEGEMGAGKTTLIKELIRQAESPDQGGSPTFSLVNEYQSPKGPLYHFDLYRVKTEEEALDFGIDEYLDSGSICFIEWPDIILDLIPRNHHSVKIINKDGTRIIKFA